MGEPDETTDTLASGVLDAALSSLCWGSLGGFAAWRLSPLHYSARHYATGEVVETMRASMVATALDFEYDGVSPSLPSTRAT